jgi:hypothetical protein
MNTQNTTISMDLNNNFKRKASLISLVLIFLILNLFFPKNIVYANKTMENNYSKININHFYKGLDNISGNNNLIFNMKYKKNNFVLNKYFSHLYCGDGICSPLYENLWNCPFDCYVP